MGQALYRKHRPKSLKEVIGQEHITTTLSKALEQGRISHAYLFTGPRGVGKTSIARILAHEINTLPYDDDSSHIDIIEIDAASNRRIDEIRELREKVAVAPTSAKYKVYIIDEVHMLTKEAFNALLKTLEEPPAHVVFILATTDAHKLPGTIISRTQRFTFKPVDKVQVTAHLQQIADQEKLSVSQEALELLAEHGDGSFRDSISLLDQAATQDHNLGVDEVRQLLGIPPAEAVWALLQAIEASSEAVTVMTKLNELYESGYQAAAIAKQLGRLMRQQLLEGQGGLESKQTLDLLRRLLEVPISRDPERYLEIVLLEALPEQDKTLSPSPLPQSPEAPAKHDTKKAGITQVRQEPPTLADPPRSTDNSSTPLGIDVWPQILQALKQKHNTLYGVVRMAKPSFPEPEKLVLTFAFAFHEKRIKESSNRQKLAAIIQELTGQKVSVDCLFDKNARPPQTAKAVVSPPSSAHITAISNIFGGAELLES